MKHTPTIRAELDRYLQQEGLSIAQFGQLAGMNRGAVSAIVSGNKSMSVNQIDRITEAMGLPEGYFYDLFIENFIIDYPPNMRRIEPFLFRCAELDKLDAIRRVVGAIMDNLLYSPKLFEIAEELLEQGRHAAALLLYEGVAEAERYQHSERLAICQYRMFKIQIRDDQERNLQAALQFESYVKRLDAIDQLDAFVDLANVYRSLRKWERVEKVAKELRALGEAQYSMAHSLKRERGKMPLRPLFFYITFSGSLIGGANYEQGNYELALQAAYESCDLDWVKENDEETLRWKNLFREWGQANVYLAKLMAGDIEVLPLYTDLISTNREELLPGLWNIMVVANRYKLNVDGLLSQFEWEISNIHDQEGRQTNDKQNINDQLVGLLSELADYYLTKGQYKKGISYLLDCMRISTIVNNEHSILRCVRMFERCRQFVSDEVKVQYRNLVEMG
ncbi:helix-turn-helix domain-containing protein [Paenibacillus sp. FSL M8-0228]|uniref:helix-turn-helix domain-containing protein n=1 Tax=Paenibacillus TaxID=44249 RepID=UPI000F96171F|nr:MULTISPECIES: helix-turn-helix domain-containing protein [Paenibacillus]MBO3286910.1 helix-turn-helix transcriptional regulator [Paenibacillus polymyxa]MBP1307350.1 transcriptional regulator with XRE-family HTH domain [Paenibacillus sp. 1182]